MQNAKQETPMLHAGPNGVFRPARPASGKGSIEMASFHNSFIAPPPRRSSFAGQYVTLEDA